MKPIVILLMGALFPMSGFAQTVGSYCLYTHDNVGNIISREKALSQNRQRSVSNEEAASRNAGADSLVTIKADASWSEVQIEIKGEISSGETLSIYTSEGFFVTFLRVESNKFSLNLAYLQKGTYLFRFRRNKNLIQQKIIKEN